MFRTLAKFSLIRNISVASATRMNSADLNKKAYINGEWVSALSKKVFDIKNPVNEAVIANVPDMDVEDTQRAIQAASDAFQTFQYTTPKERAHYLRKWHEAIVKNIDEISKIMTMECGKPLNEAKAEVMYGTSFIEWFSEQARNVRGEIIHSPDKSKKILVEHEPIGVVGLITPWNFPHAMIARKASAALAVGCTCVIRPAEDTPLTALILMEMAQEAGIPKGVLNVVTSGRENAAPIGKLLCESPLVAGISFTGSTTVGKILYQQCAKGVKRLALELGGNAPFIVFESANMDKVIRAALVSKFRNCGQTCAASNRFLIHESLCDQFIERLSGEIKKMKVGDGCEDGVQLGPQINKAQFDKVSHMVNDAVSKGAKVLLGGKSIPSLGPFFYEPTILINLSDNMEVYNNEIFGPVVGIIKFKTEEESLKIANSTAVGLAGYFFSEDYEQIFRVSRKLQVGMVGVNEGLISTAEAPFGGVKESGLGREGSHHGIEDFSQLKYICLGGLS